KVPQYPLFGGTTVAVPPIPGGTGPPSCRLSLISTHCITSILLRASGLSTSSIWYVCPWCKICILEAMPLLVGATPRLSHARPVLGSPSCVYWPWLMTHIGAVAPLRPGPCACCKLPFASTVSAPCK